MSEVQIMGESRFFDDDLIFEGVERDGKESIGFEFWERGVRMRMWSFERCLFLRVDGNGWGRGGLWVVMQRERVCCYCCFFFS